MYVLIDENGQASLEESHDFKRLSVKTRIDPKTGDATRAITALGPIIGGDVHLACGGLRDMGPADEAWRGAFDEMIAYAAKAGWVDLDGNVRAHLVYEPLDTDS